MTQPEIRYVDEWRPEDYDLNKVFVRGAKVWHEGREVWQVTITPKPTAPPIEIPPMPALPEPKAMIGRI